MTHRRLAVLLLLLSPTSGWAQQPPATASDPIEAIDAEFSRKFQDLERQRLAQLAELAARSEGQQAVRVYETYFRSALGSGLYQEAEPIAERVLNDGAPAPAIRYLAEVANIMAEADRGDFEESLQSIVKAVLAGHDAADDEADLARRSLPVTARLSLLDAYYQRLVQAGQYEIARKAFATIRENQQEGNEPEVQEYLANRIEQLDLIGQPAPAFSGLDVDGRPVQLGDFAGKPVLLVFWATWHRPNADQIAWMKAAFPKYRDRGLQIVGVNVDALAEGGRTLEEVLPEVRRYVLEYNIPWQNLVNVPGDGDIADAYGVTEIPANVLIDPSGRIAGLDLSAANFGQELERVLGEAGSQ